MGRLWVFFLSHTAPWVSIVVLFPPLYVGRHWGLALEAALEGSGLLLWGPSVEVLQRLGSQEEELAARVAGNTVL